MIDWLILLSRNLFGVANGGFLDLLSDFDPSLFYLYSVCCAF